VDVADLKVEEIDGGEYVTALVKNEGRPATEVLAEKLAEVVANVKFGKSMRWNDSGIAFSRPIRWYLALFGDALLPFEYADIVPAKSTRGLRPYGSPEIEVVNPQAYFDAIKEQGILLNYDERQKEIQAQIKKLADEVDGIIPDDPGLLAEVTNLVESPVAMRGAFEEKYLDLPRDVLVMVMRKHQRYFPLEDKNGDLLPYFIAVRNGDDQHLDIVVDGNEHVIRARFSDAEFFYNEDLKKPLRDYLPRLGTLTFQEKLGSMLDKNERIVDLVDGIGDLLGYDATDIGIAQKASHLVKADLATQMVVEMTSLQGIMGREYALKQDLPEDVADAIFEHWLPRSAGDKLPASNAGTILAVADRLDSLVGLFAAGLAPKSTADPYGLRRAALGIIQIVISQNLDVDLRHAISIAAEAQPINVSDEIKTQVMEFIAGRLENWLVDEDEFARDVINAVLAEQAHNPYSAINGIKELSGWVSGENWESVLDNFARCVRITRSEEEQFSVDADKLIESQEKALYEAYIQATEKLGDDGNVGAFLMVFEPMVPVVADFFDNVLVNAEDDAVRQNRLGLLQAISAMQNGRADLSQLSGF